MVSCKTRLFRGLCRMFRHMLRRNRVMEVTLLLAAAPLLSRGGLGVVQVDKEKCPPRLEGHDEHSSFDQYDRPSTIEPIGITPQSRFITVASGNVAEITTGVRKNRPCLFGGGLVLLPLTLPSMASLTPCLRHRSATRTWMYGANHCRPAHTAAYDRSN
jgi:hypothetical protein